MSEPEDLRAQLKQKFEEATKIVKVGLETVLWDYRRRCDERVAEIEGKLRASEAGAAAMREVLRCIASWDPPGSDSAANWLSETCRRGLAGDAGALFLVENEKLRREYAAMRAAFVELGRLVGTDCPSHQMAGFQFDCDACAAKNEGNEWIAIMRAALGRA